MDLFGVGSSELILLLFLGGVLLGPRRLAGLARSARQLMRQIQSLSRDLTKELNREIDLLEAGERPSGPSPDAEARQEAKPPEAYRRFREDFPDEGSLDNLSRQRARGRQQPSQEAPPASTPARQQKGADASEPEPSKAH